MVSGPINCVKYLVFFFNLIFFLFGIALVAVGSYVQAELADFLTLYDSNISGPAVVLIVVGLIIFIVAFFGCCGAIKENYCMVLTFSILMMIILICQIGGAIAGFVYSHKIADVTRDSLLASMKDFNDDPEVKEKEKNGVTRSWNFLQEKFTCCGVNTPEDWKLGLPKVYGGHPPLSCCNATEKGACKPYGDPTIYPHGCEKDLENLFEKNVYYIGAVGISLAVIQVMGIVLSCCLARAVHKEYDVE
ncbi:CD63 antigen-like isoform X2 [Watersipora subatra]|uniref:CD63 antigen-like isoform X2 n=1 Tax=Watersipora subatra TaxID=2589382 RepID=UPI00355C6F32